VRPSAWGKPRRILMLVYNPCVRDARVLKESAALAASGYAVTVVAVVEDGAPDRERRNGVEFRRVPNRLSGVTGRLGLPGLAPGLPWEAARFLGYWSRAFRVGLALRPDVVHAHDLDTLPAAWAVARATGARLVYDAHELYCETSSMPPGQRPLWRALEARLAPRCDAIVTVSPSIAAELARRYGVAEPTIVLNCPPRRAAATSRRLRDALSLPDGVRIVLYQGGLTPTRGLPELVRAAGALREDAVLVVMGWGPLEPELRRLARDEGLDGRVRFLPPVSQEVLLDWTASADVGVIPFQAASLNNTYACPNKLFEYLQAGLPVAASDLPELARVVRGEGVGVTFDPTSPAAIAAAVDRLLGCADSADLRERVDLARARYCWEEEAETLLGVYAGLRAAPGRSAS